VTCLSLLGGDEVEGYKRQAVIADSREQVPIAGHKRGSRRWEREQRFIAPHFLERDFWSAWQRFHFHW
jgi:hypothetical protein